MIGDDCMGLIPTVIEKNKKGERAYDIYTTLLKDRIIILCGEIDDINSNTIVAQLLYLDSLNNNDISLYINSPGGSVTGGMAIYDTMNFIKSDVSTICLGMAASMAAFLLSSGAKGKDIAYLIVSNDSSTTWWCTRKLILRLQLKNFTIKDKLNQLLAKNTGQKLEKFKILNVIIWKLLKKH